MWADIRNMNPTAYTLKLPSPEAREKRLIEAMVIVYTHVLHLVSSLTFLRITSSGFN